MRVPQLFACVLTTNDLASVGSRLQRHSRQIDQSLGNLCLRNEDKQATSALTSAVLFARSLPLGSIQNRPLGVLSRPCGTCNEDKVYEVL